MSEISTDESYRRAMKSLKEYRNSVIDECVEVLRKEAFQAIGIPRDDIDCLVELLQEKKE